MSADPIEERTVELGGVTYYVPADRSMANDLWIEAEARRAGLDSLHIEDGEDGRQFANRVIASAVDGGRLLPLLGGLLHPVGVQTVDWTPDVAARTASALGRLVDPDEKAALRTLAAEFLASFFLNGLASATTSPTSWAARLKSGEPFAAGLPKSPTAVH